MAKNKQQNKRQPQTPAANTALPAPVGKFSNPLRLAAILAAVSFLLYANTLGHDYTLDDAIVITDNMFTQKGISGIPGLFQYDTFYGFFKEEGKAALVAGGRYRPLTPAMFAVEVQLFGLKPFAGHLFNVLWYMLTVVVLFALLRQLFLFKTNADRAGFIAFVAALIFAAHPIHTEVVANIKGRDEIIALLGSLAAVWCALKAHEQPSGALRWHLLGGVSFFLALLSKENAITFLAVLPLTFYYFTNAKGSSIAKLTVPVVAATVLFLAIRFSIVPPPGKPPMELMNNPFLKYSDRGYYVQFSYGEQLATIIYTLGEYLRLLVYPHPLTHDYYPRHVEIMNWEKWQVSVSMLLHIGLAVYAVIGLLKKELVSYGILFYLLTLSIVSNLFFPVGTNMAERLIFMPSAGFALAVAVLLDRAHTRWGATPALSLLAGVIFLFGLQTILRNPVWKDNLTLFTTDIAVSKNSAKLCNAVGGELYVQSTKEKNETKRMEMLNEAVQHLENAVRIHPQYKNAYLLLGNCYNNLKVYEKSIASYKMALLIDPVYKEATDNLGITYREAGLYYGETEKNPRKALEFIEKAYETRPDEYETLRLLGVAYGSMGNIEKAIEFFAKALAQKPEDAMANYNLGISYQYGGNAEQAALYMAKAEKIEPGIVQKMSRTPK
ncbi:MAG: tetratricopeptide repeat protein [Saprospiraceae bacterium]|nr:tetratricopeptide repeat protein [Saprospiraceae bacterium]